MKFELIHHSLSKCPIAQCAAVRFTHDGERDDDQNRRDCERDPHTGQRGGIGLTLSVLTSAATNVNTAPIPRPI